jgi:tripartite-type tricarboxylate transporter receptor subunit TctC
LRPPADSCFISHSSLLPVLQANRGRLVAVTSAERRPLTPDIPAIAELFPDYDLESWTGAFAPAGTPEPVLRRFVAALHHALNDPGIQARLTNLGIDPVISTPETYAVRIQRDREVARQIVEATGLRVG